MILASILFFSSCTKEIIEDSSVKVTTGGYGYISTDMTECYATIEAKSSKSVLQRGICYGSRPMPALENEGYIYDEGYTYVTKNGQGSGEFTAILKGLPDNCKVYYRAYAKTKKGVVYGEDKELYIGGNPSGTLSWNTCTWTHPNYADVKSTYSRDYSYQTVYSDQRGFVYSEDPDFNSFERLVVGWDYVYGNTTFNGTITDLDPNKTYYVKSFILYNGMALYSSTKELHYGY